MSYTMMKVPITTEEQRQFADKLHEMYEKTRDYVTNNPCCTTDSVEDASCFDLQEQNGPDVEG